MDKLFRWIKKDPELLELYQNDSTFRKAFLMADLEDKDLTSAISRILKAGYKLKRETEEICGVYEKRKNNCTTSR